MADTLQDLVHRRIWELNDLYAVAIDDIEDDIYITDSQEETLHQLKNNKQNMLGWAARGRDALVSDTEPCAAGWSGWFSAGDAYGEGVGSLLGVSDWQTITDHMAGTADDISELPAEAIAVVSEVGAKVRDGAEAALKGVASYTRTGLLVAVGIVVVGAGVYLYVTRR
ncbi:MAG: hypothetical protein KAT00_04910 [Planctomycetes bacterium]|nr:hypothetical protein [Planctomycetota bacterium]